MQYSVLLISLDLDGQLLSGRESTLVGQGEEADLVQSIRGVRDQFTKEDLRGGKREREREREEIGGKSKSVGMSECETVDS